ncbi:LacI family DNA-binding transcriptional regulator [Rhodococcus opacus]|uniref:LacI family DNA-binding transcriptional regulator n=1 Tax=Rhodococcus opacus TaxID=37919 RepID=UPI0024BBC488|nr:LacI family DNA-binding transcriptional regulator [Rhodococcus opacus]
MSISIMAKDIDPPGNGSGVSTPARAAAVTMRDVAEHAGVSVATVSLVINNKKRDRIGEATRTRVKKAVAELGYRPNILAQSLGTGQSRFIGMIADAIATLPYAGQILRGAQEEAWRNGYVLLVVDTDDVAELTDDALRMMIDHKAVGVLYSTWYHTEVQPPSLLASVPSVFVNCFTSDPTGYAVVPNEVQGGFAATQLLTSQGHRRIAFVNSTEIAPSTSGRFEGYREALAEVGVGVDPALQVSIDPDAAGGFQEAGYAAGHELLSRGNAPTAVFCYNDRVAMGMYDALKEHGLSIPGDIAIVGFDDQEVIAAHLRPRLTSIALPHYELGVRGVQALLKRVEQGDSLTGVERIDCPPVVRSSI